MSRGRHAGAAPRGGGPAFAWHVAVACSVALPIALWNTEVHVVPAAEGLWRGLADAPGVARGLVALAAGALVACLVRREPAAVRRPLLVLGLAAAPLVPLLSGRGLALLGFQRPALVLLLAAALAVAAVRVWSRRRDERGAARGDAAPPPSTPAPVAPPRDAGWRRDVALAGIALLFFAWLGRHLPGPAGAQGDEPHYLLIAQSLLSDGDVDLADDYAQREYQPFFGGTLQAHTSPASPRGVIYEVHTPGLAVLLLPAYALGGYAGAKLFIALLAALTAALAGRLAREVSGSAALGVAAWAGLTLVPPLPVYAQALYPETPAALATVVFLLCARRAASWGTLTAAALAAGALPWLHPKFLPLAGVGLLLALLRPAHAAARTGLARGTALGIFVLAFGGLLYFFHALYGSASLSAAYGPRFVSDVSLARVPWGLPALFFDRQFGLLAAAPLWALALPGGVALARGRPGDVLRAVVLAGATLGVGASFSMWWGGACPPARFVVPALPALALLLTAAFRLRRDAAVALTAAGLVVLLLAADAPRALHNRADGQSGLLHFLVPSLDLDGLLPSFVVGGSEAWLLSLSLLVVLVLGWARGVRGLAVGLIGYALLAGAWRAGALVDRRTSVARLIHAWDDARLVSLAGPLDPAALTLPLDLPHAPWTLRQGDVRRTRRVAVPPGLYRLEVTARPGTARTAVHLARFEAFTDDLSLDWVFLRTDRPLQPLTLMLPGGAPRLTLVASGVADESIVESARLVPLALVPLRLRETFRFPAVPQLDRHRVGDETLRVTVTDRSQPEGEGYRLDGEWGQFTLETPPGAPIEVHIRRGHPADGDTLWWHEREIALPREGEVLLKLPNEGGVRLGDADALPVILNAEGAWIAFRPAR